MEQLIPLAEIFHSIQGEGINTGKPSIFIRFRGCDKRCGYCDTPYAVIDHTDMKKVSLSEIISSVQAFPCKHIIFTGGEPALFQSQIKDIQRTLGEGYTYEIETNGGTTLEPIYNQVNVSYKTSNSNNPKYELKAIDRINNSYDYKFVVKDMNDIEEVEGIISEYNLSKEHIYLMPLGVDKDSQTNLLVADYCMMHGYRYCQRMHILLFGNRRGV